MRAAVFVQNDKDLVIEDVTPVPPGPHDVVVRVTATGVCQSDVSVLNGRVPLPPPAILGHEAAGVVEAVGSEVTLVGPGDRVIAAVNPACGRCSFCLDHESNFCEQTEPVRMIPRVTGADGTPIATFGLGSFADTMTCHEISLVKAETDLPDEQLALISCAVNTGVGAAINTAGVRPGSTVVVIGCGGVGQSVVQGARIAGAARIIAVDPVAAKRSAALGFGATDALDPATVDPVEQIRELTNGRGADYAFEAIGNPATVLQAFESIRPGGTCVVVGVPRFDQAIALPGMPLVFTGKRIIGSAFGSANVRTDFPRLIRLAEHGALDLAGMVSSTMRLDEVNTAIRALTSGEAIRPVIVGSAG